MRVLCKTCALVLTHLYKARANYDDAQSKWASSKGPNALFSKRKVLSQYGTPPPKRSLVDPQIFCTPELVQIRAKLKKSSTVNINYIDVILLA
jgi:hypothetical protein